MEGTFFVFQGIYGLEEAINEIKECKIQIRKGELELEAVINENNQVYITINQLIEENEDFRERLGDVFFFFKSHYNNNSVPLLTLICFFSKAMNPANKSTLASSGEPEVLNNGSTKPKIKSWRRR